MDDAVAYCGQALRGDRRFGQPGPQPFENHERRLPMISNGRHLLVVCMPQVEYRGRASDVPDGTAQTRTPGR
jgi:hypothetical protein